MVKFKFIRRQCEVECYNRAKKLLESITIPTLRARLEKVIAEYETKSKIIELFENHPNLEERTICAKTMIRYRSIRRTNWWT